MPRRSPAGCSPARGRARLIKTSDLSTSCWVPPVLSAFPGDRAEVFEDLAVLGQDLLGLQAGVEVVIARFTAATVSSWAAASSASATCTSLLGGLTPQPERAEPRELLGQRQVIGVVSHQEILGCDARDGKDRVRGDRVVERRHLRDAVP